MTILDWVILFGYFLGMILLGLILMLKQKTPEDYYLAGRGMPAWMIGASMAATQASAVSLIGGPAFVAVKKGGGLIWLQYELAVPLAMGLLIPLIVGFHRLKLVSIYAFVENRFGVSVRMLLSILFQISRGLATGVSLFATALIFGYLLKVPIWTTLFVVGGIALTYTLFGGIMADIISDFIQLWVLWLGVAVGIGVVYAITGKGLLTHVPLERLSAFDFSGHGFGDGKVYSFWAMLFGGLFLYLSYYGCDQSQAQRLLTAPDAKVASKGLLYNSLIRFPLVLTYLFFGVVLAGFLSIHSPEWTKELSNRPDALVPLFVKHYFPTGIRGLFLAAIMAAAMSSFDSAFNSLSAATLEDLNRIGKVPKVLKGELLGPRLLTLGWGLFSIFFAWFLTKIKTPTVIELINMIGSVLYGPILSAFILGILPLNTRGKAVFIGIMTGVIGNILVAKLLPSVSWFWWNLIGCVISLTVAILLSKTVFMYEIGIPRFYLGINKSHLTYMAVLFLLFFIVVVGSWLFSLILKDQALKGLLGLL